jgi:hypothetical protein
VAELKRLPSRKAAPEGANGFHETAVGGFIESERGGSTMGYEATIGRVAIAPTTPEVNSRANASARKSSASGFSTYHGTVTAARDWGIPQSAAA